MKTLLALITLIVILCMTSCTGCSKSGRIVTPLLSEAERVVIIDRIYTPIGFSDDDPIYRYKVKRIDKGVVDFVDLDYLFNINDTILYQFWN